MKDIDDENLNTVVLTPEDLKTFCRLIHEKTGNFCHHFKKGVVARRITRRMGLGGARSVRDYLEMVSESDSEAALLAADLMIGVTSFFRDTRAWDALGTTVIRKLAAEDDEAPVRVWTPACATGEEAYSVAVMLHQEFELAGRRRQIQVFATDVNERALEKARTGTYPASAAADIPPDYLRKFFTFSEDGLSVTIGKEIRESVIFARQDLLADPSFSRLDLLICRNFLIYLEPHAQERCIALFHYALKGGGYLFLGNAESVGRNRSLFKTLGLKECRIYRKVESDPPVRIPAPLHPAPERPPAFHSRDASTENRARSVVAFVQDAPLDEYAIKTLNDELRASNEELQAANEELETSREELQTLNEELLAVNSQLQAAKEEWERTFDTVPDLVAILDYRHRIVRVNRAMADRLGLTPEQCIGLPCHEGVHGLSHPPAFCPHALTCTDGRQHMMEVHEPRLGGDFIVSTTPLLDEQGRPTGAVHVARDITERKRAEEALRESREDLNRAQAVAYTGSWRLNVRGNDLRWSDETYRIFGIPLGAPLTYEAFLSAVHPDDREYVDRKWTAALKGEPYDIEHRIVVAGELKWVRERAELEFDAEGMLLGGFGTVQDITGLKTAEDALRKAHDELERRVQERTAELVRANEELEAEIMERFTAEKNLLRLNRLYRVLSEANHAIVRSNDRDALFSDICRIVVEHGGFSMAWVGLVDDESGMVRPVARYGADNGFLEDIRISAREEPEGSGPTGTACREGHITVFNDMLNDPRMFPWRGKARECNFRASAAIALKVNGKVIGALTIYSNQTDFFEPEMVELLKQMAMDVSLALENLDRAKSLRQKDQLLMMQSRQAAMGEMIGNIAHQWRQPLNALSLIVQTLPVTYEMGDLTPEFLASMEDQAMRLILHMSQTIDDFRNYFKPDKEKVPFSVNRAVSKTIALIEESFKNLDIAIEVDAPDDPVINGYPNEYSQVLLNILSNARDALSERRIADARVTVHARAENGKAVVTISDNAGGIPEDVVGKIFEPYFTTKGPDKGTGVGLYMSKGIIEKNMGGRITVRNTERGAEFRIEV